MTTISKIRLVISLGALAIPLTLSAQQPSCHQCSGTYIPKDEIDQYFKRVPASTAVADQQVRATDAGKINVDIGVVYRGKLGPNPRPVAEHDLVSEVYHV